MIIAFAALLVNAMCAPTADMDDLSMMQLGVATNSIKAEYRKKDYFLIEAGMDWQQSEDACVLAGGHLASIADQAENDVVAAMCNRSVCTTCCCRENPSRPDSANLCWIGGRKLPSDLSSGAFEWTDGTPVTFVNPDTYSGGQFVNYASQSAMAIWNPATGHSRGKFEAGKWHFEPASWKGYPAVCERHEPTAVGDPHMTNIHGQRFDLAQPGEHTLVRLPMDVQDEVLLQSCCKSGAR